MGIHDTNGDSWESERPMGIQEIQKQLESHETNEDSVETDWLMEKNGESWHSERLLRIMGTRDTQRD